MMKNVIGIIGLGYVGLPLGVAFGKKFRTIGFDIDQKRVNDLKKIFDLSDENKITLKNNVNIQINKIESLKLINFLSQLE